MERKSLINWLVARKLKSCGKRNALCVCMARALCGSHARRPALINPKS
jgi:hypothetical protein